MVFYNCVYFCRPHIKDSGSADLSVDGVSLSVSVTVGKCTAG